MSRTYPIDLSTQATLYVSTLFPGDIVEDGDATLAEFRHLLPGALARRHLRLEWIGFDQWAVRPSLPKELPTFAEAMEQLEKAAAR